MCVLEHTLEHKFVEYIVTGYNTLMKTYDHMKAYDLYKYVMEYYM